MSTNISKRTKRYLVYFLEKSDALGLAVVIIQTHLPFYFYICINSLFMNPTILFFNNVATSLYGTGVRKVSSFSYKIAGFPRKLLMLSYVSTYNTSVTSSTSHESQKQTNANEMITRSCVQCTSMVNLDIITVKIE